MHLLGEQAANDKFAGKTVEGFTFSEDPQLTKPELATIRFTDGTSAMIRLETFGPEGFQKVMIAG